MKKLTPLRAIRAKCLDCSGGNRAEVRRCEIEDCALWGFRSGHKAKTGAKGSGTVARIGRSASGDGFMAGKNDFSEGGRYHPSREKAKSKLGASRGLISANSGGSGSAGEAGG